MTLLSHTSLSNYGCLSLAVLQTPSTQGSLCSFVYLRNYHLVQSRSDRENSCYTICSFYATRQVFVSSCLTLIHPCIQSDW